MNQNKDVKVKQIYADTKWLGNEITNWLSQNAIDILDIKFIDSRCAFIIYRKIQDALGHQITAEDILGLADVDPDIMPTDYKFVRTRIEQLKDQLNDPEVLDKAKVESKLAAYLEIEHHFKNS